MEHLLSERFSIFENQSLLSLLTASRVEDLFRKGVDKALEIVEGKHIYPILFSFSPDIQKTPQFHKQGYFAFEAINAE